MPNRMTSSKTVVRRLKEKCKDAARMRREKERSEFVELSKLLPLPSSTTSQLDRASIIRLTSSYLRMRAAFPEGLGENWGTHKPASSSLSSSSDCNSHVASRSSLSASSTPPTNDALAGDRPRQIDTIHVPCEQQTSSRRQFNQPSKQQNQHPHLHQTQVKELGSLILQTLDGFVFALHSDGKIMYISETASVLLGLPQIDLTGSSIFDYIDSSDVNDLLDTLNLNESDRCALQSQIEMNATDRADGLEYLELNRSFSMRMKCVLPRRNAGLIQNGYKSIHCTGYLKVKRCWHQQPSSMLNSGGKHLDKTIGHILQQSTASKDCNPRLFSHIKQSKNRAISGSQDWESYALVAVGHSLLPSASTEIKLNRNSFMFRAYLDMKIFFIENSALSLLGHDQNGVMGQSLYQLAHVADSKQLGDAHRALLNKGQVVSRYFRLMRRDAGSVWVQMQATLINNSRSMPRPVHIVGICLIIGANHSDESQLMLDELPNNNRKDSCIQMNATFNPPTNSMGQTNKRRPPIKSHLGADDFQTTNNIAPKPISSNSKRASARRKDKLESSSKRIRQFIELGQKAESEVMDKFNDETQRQIDLDKREINRGNPTHNQPIGQLRRLSDDTCSVASSVTSASTTSASTTSNVGQFKVSCPPSSIASGCLYTSSSPQSLSTTMGTSVSQYLPIQRTPPITAEAMESIPQVGARVSPTDQHMRLHEQQLFYTQVTTSGNQDVGPMICIDSSRYSTHNYWPIETDDQNSIDQGRLCTEGIHNQPMPAPNYYNLDEQQMEIDDHSRSYRYYSNNEVTFYNGSHNVNLQSCGAKCNSENFVVDQFTPHQYSYLADNKANRESINKTPMTPAVRSYFVTNQSF